MLLAALKAVADRDCMRIAHYSIQGNHLHLIVDAENAAGLSKAMRGLAVRIARRLNARLGRRGAVFGDRYHAHLLRSRREVANAVRYVVDNRRRHASLQADFRDPLATTEDAPLAVPRLWLLRIGWRLEPPRRPERRMS